jgi:hypothetical protein
MTSLSARNRCRFCLPLMALLGVSVLAIPRARGQSQEMKERLAEVKAALAKNRQQLAQYTWTEQDIISLKGEEKKEELFQVRLGPDGKPQKTNLDPASMSDEERHRHGLRARIVEKKKEEYKEYADSMKNLMQQYLPPEKDLLDQAYQKGNVMIGPAGVPHELRLVVTNYIKPQDSMTIVFDRQTKQMLSIAVASYLEDPSDVVKLNVQFSSLPDGTNHIASMVIDGVSKQLSIALTNANYQKV